MKINYVDSDESFVLLYECAAAYRKTMLSMATLHREVLAVTDHTKEYTEAFVLQTMAITNLIPRIKELDDFLEAGQARYLAEIKVVKH